jgi:hypothetical protein
MSITREQGKISSFYICIHMAAGVRTNAEVPVSSKIHAEIHYVIKGKSLEEANQDRVRTITSQFPILLKTC